MLEERSDDEHHVLQLLRCSHHADAMRILGRLRAGDDAHSVADFALDLTSTDLTAGRATPSGSSRIDQSSANGVSVPSLDGTLPLATRDMLSFESNVESTGRMQQREQVSVSDAKEISLPSFQTLSYDTNVDFFHIAFLLSITGLWHAHPPRRIFLKTCEEGFTADGWWPVDRSWGWRLW